MDKILRSHRIVRPKGRMMLTIKHLHFTAAMSSWIWLTFTVAVVLNVVDVHGRFVLDMVDFCKVYSLRDTLAMGIGGLCWWLA